MHFLLITNNKNLTSVLLQKFSDQEKFELKKQKVKLSLPQKEDLISWYKDKSEQLNKIKQKIDTLDHSIDQEVYKLYNLTDEEIKIIEEN